MCIAHHADVVVINIVSSLTSDDENVCAPALLQHFVSILRQLPIAYAIRIETTDQVFQHSVPIQPAAADAGVAATDSAWAGFADVVARAD